MVHIYGKCTFVKAKLVLQNGFQFYGVFYTFSKVIARGAVCNFVVCVLHSSSSSLDSHLSVGVKQFGCDTISTREKMKEKIVYKYENSSNV